MNRSIQTILAGVFSVITYSLDIGIYKWYLFSIAIFLFIWQLINIVWLDPKLKIILQYKLLTQYLEKLSSINNSDKMKSKIFTTSNFDVSPCWEIYFKQKQRDTDIRFNELNTMLEKINNHTYYLLCANKKSIGTDFIKLFSGTKELYETFSVLVQHENIQGINFNETNDTYNHFILLLEQSRNKCPEIKHTVLENLISPLSLPPSKIFYNPYAGV